MSKTIYAVSGRARHGKDTAADVIEDILGKENIIRVAYADHLKDIAKSIGWNGEKDEKGRTLLQNLSEPIKEYHGRDYFSKYVCNLIENSELNEFLITDVRFLFEAKGLEEMQEKGYNVVLIRVFREEDETWESPLTDEQKLHESEVEMDSYEGIIDILRIQNKDLSEFQEKIKEVVNKELKKNL